MEYTEKQETLYRRGLDLLKEYGTASCTLFQQKLCIGYISARAIFERMLAEGVAVLQEEFILTLNKEKSDEV